MNRFQKILLLFIPFLGLLSCQDPVQAELDAGAELYVIDAFISTRFDGQIIRIKNSSAYFSDAEPTPVTNAKVHITNLNSGEMFTAYYSREDIYQISTPKEKFVTGDWFQLDVEIDGNRFRATTVLNRPAKIDSISAELYTPPSVDPRSQIYYLCTVWARDPGGPVPDYYWVQEGSGRNNSYINICIDGTGAATANNPGDSMYFTTPYNKVGYRLFRPGSACGVDIHSVSRETYDFLRQAYDQILNTGLFAKTPQNVPTNFVPLNEVTKKAVGWFSVANTVHTYSLMPL